MGRFRRRSREGKRTNADPQRDLRKGGINLDPLTIGILVTVLLLGVGGFFLFSSMSGATSIWKALGVGAGTGILESITAVFSDAWKFIVASMYGHLGLYGYILIFGLIACVAIWAWNGFQDVAKNRPISFVD